MIVKLNRCKHCGKEYEYYVSGVCSEYNNDTYCNDCYKTMMDSLKKIPRKYAPILNHEDACSYLTEALKDLYYKKEP